MVATAEQAVDLDHGAVVAGKDRDVAHAAASDAALAGDIRACLLGIDRVEGHLLPACETDGACAAVPGSSLGARDRDAQWRVGTIGQPVGCVAGTLGSR